MSAVKTLSEALAEIARLQALNLKLQQRIAQLVAQHGDANAPSLTECTPSAVAATAAENEPPLKRKRSEEEPLVVYTDGSASKNGLPGAKAGSAAIASDGRRWAARTPGAQTSSRAELYAGIVGLSMTREAQRATLYTDSEYFALGVNEQSRLARWARNGWKKQDGTVVVSIDLWKMVWALITERRERKLPPVAVLWVKGHAGIVGNEEVDKLADRAAQMQPEAAGYPVFEGIAEVFARAGLGKQTAK